MEKQYAQTQICIINLSMTEVETMIRDNLKVRGGDPSYDFAVNQPIFIWSDRGVSVRYVQADVFDAGMKHAVSLTPIPRK